MLMSRLDIPNIVFSSMYGPLEKKCLKVHWPVRWLVPTTQPIITFSFVCFGRYWSTLARDVPFAGLMVCCFCCLILYFPNFLCILVIF